MDDIVEINYAKDILNNEVDEEVIKAVQEEGEKAKAESAFDMDEALRTYDPTFPNYTPSEEAFEFFNIMRLVQGADFEFSSPIAHYFMVDILLGMIDDPMVFPYSKEVCETIAIDDLSTTFLCSRGLGKSSVAITFYIVYLAIKGELPKEFGKVYFVLALSASTRGGARVNAMAVRSMCEDSKFVKDYFEKTRFTETEIEFVRKGPGAVSSRTFIARFQGVGTGIRGQRANAGSAASGGATRPNIIIFDDCILNTAAAYSKTIQDNLHDIISSDAENALVGGHNKKIITCATPFHSTDVNVAPVLAGAVTPVILPLCPTFNSDGPVKAKELVSSWPEMHPPKAIARQFNNAVKKGTTSAFLLERQLQMTASSDRLVPDGCFQYADVQNIVKNIHAYNIYITTDYTTTSGEKSDFSGRATWALSNNGDVFMLDIALRKMDMEEQYKGTLNEAANWKRLGKHVEIGVELDGGQTAHVYSLEQEMQKRGDYYTFARDRNNPTSDRKGILSRSTGVKKHERFRIASQVMQQKKLWLPEHLKNSPDLQEWIQQVKGATHEQFTRSDDGPDLLSMLQVSMQVILPSEAPAVVSSSQGYTRSVFSDFEDEEEDEYGGSTVF